MLFRPGDELEHKAVKHAALFTHRLQARSCTFKSPSPLSLLLAWTPVWLGSELEHRAVEHAAFFEHRFPCCA